MIKTLAFSFYCCCAWALASLFLWSIGKVVRDGLSQLKRLHQIPCSRCVFFTNDYRLKCTVHPSNALSEDAIDCLDFEPTTSLYPCCGKRAQQNTGLLQSSGNIISKKWRSLSR